MVASGRGRSPKVVRGRGWPPVVSKIAENEPSRTARRGEENRARGAVRQLSDGFDGCPW